MKKSSVLQTAGLLGLTVVFGCAHTSSELIAVCSGSVSSPDGSETGNVIIGPRRGTPDPITVIASGGALSITSAGHALPLGKDPACTFESKKIDSEVRKESGVHWAHESPQPLKILCEGMEKPAEAQSVRVSGTTVTIFSAASTPTLLSGAPARPVICVMKP